MMRAWEGKPPVSDSETKREVSLGEIQKRNNAVLSKTGLSLESVQAAGVVMSEEGTEYPSELRINLSDGRQFVKYLESLKGGILSPSQKTGLERVVLSLVSQLRGQYDLDNAEDERLLELFGNASKIISEYERLDAEGVRGLHTSISELQELVAVSKKGYLREYLLAEENQFLIDIGEHKFGPSEWHR